MNAPRPRLAVWLSLLATVAFCISVDCVPAAAQDRLEQDLARFKAEIDPVKKARDLVKLGDEQVDVARKQLKEGEDVASLMTLQQYADEVQMVALALTSAGVDAEKKPSGFKELQISLRETGRKVDDMIFTLPVEKRPFFREVRTSLASVQNDLMDALFPRNNERGSKKSPR
jgi:hypothetical protein